MLGDQIASALSRIGINSDRIEQWLGVECGCAERRDKLNQLDITLRRVVKDGIEKTKHYISLLIGEDNV